MTNEEDMDAYEAPWLSSPKGYAENADADDIRGWLLDDYDVRDAVVHYATEGMISTSDLWWLYEEHRIMAPADAWLLAAMWEEPEMVDDRSMFHPDWWQWFDRGILEARYQDQW